jgi:hypothetical protein
MANGPFHEPIRVSLAAVGVGLTATLVVIYVACALVALLLPGLRASHAWLGLFTAAPPLSAAGLVEGVLSNVAFAWLAAAVFVPVFNAVSRRRA